MVLIVTPTPNNLISVNDVLVGILVKSCIFLVNEGMNKTSRKDFQEFVCQLQFSKNRYMYRKARLRRRYAPVKALSGPCLCLHPKKFPLSYDIQPVFTHETTTNANEASILIRPHIPERKRQIPEKIVLDESLKLSTMASRTIGRRNAVS